VRLPHDAPLAHRPERASRRHGETCRERANAAGHCANRELWVWKTTMLMSALLGTETRSGIVHHRLCTCCSFQVRGSAKAASAVRTLAQASQHNFTYAGITGTWHAPPAAVATVRSRWPERSTRGSRRRWWSRLRGLDSVWGCGPMNTPTQQLCRLRVTPRPRGARWRGMPQGTAG
jgi:hypothetical protein